MGEPMPLSHLDQLGSEFLCFILDGIEKNETDEDETLSDLFLSFLLGYNLQFTPGIGSNVVLECLQNRSSANVFTSKLLLMFNREEDPVRLFPHEPAPKHSVLKMMIDLFDNEHTAALFYTNDVKVVIDILVRMISDLSPGEQKRTVYLDLCRAVLNACSYQDHRHRSQDLNNTFTRIQEEIPPCNEDVELVSVILQRHFVT
uniref:NCK-interacting protein with SH3 domain n=2 Tax=Cacopsylla melanoneura TaxID=428564 RepID=A0A8D8M4C0_9HEMI